MKSLPNCQMYRFVKSSPDATSTAKPSGNTCDHAILNAEQLDGMSRSRLGTLSCLLRSSSEDAGDM